MSFEEEQNRQWANATQAQYGKTGPASQVTTYAPRLANAAAAEETLDSNERKRAVLQAEIDKITSTDPQYQGFMDSRNALNKEIYSPTADLSQFEGLLGKLEASKMKQAGSAALDTRRNTYAQGLAQMMSNF